MSEWVLILTITRFGQTNTVTIDMPSEGSCIDALETASRSELLARGFYFRRYTMEAHK